MEEPEEPASSSHTHRNIIVGIVTLVVLVAVYFGGRALRSSLTGSPASIEQAKRHEQPAATQPAAPRAEAAPSPAPPAAAPSPGPRRRKAPVPEQPAEPPPASTTGTLHIDSDVPGAFVFLDRQFVGKAPVTAESVAPGSHQLNVSAEGYEGYSQALEVAPGRADVMVRFKEVRLHETVAVVHKHRLGSCEGKLVATPQGIRYETANENDRFMVPFSNLEVFEVNYLDKNLKIKVRDGRTYNFTDKNPNADALFVFHRNVEKARARLAKGERK
jgi:PEGA domain